ncbi:MAG: amidohydrolase, partial [Rhodobacteraceae bacterium]|nr:amidohydrolase [Paracoccaceae bacterium]
TRIMDAGGRLVLPGFQDAHIHLQMGGVDLVQTAQLYEATSLAELQSTLAAHAAATPGPMVWGAGWQPGFFGDENLTRAVLDQVVPDRPCLIYDSNFHNACVNTAACRMVGIVKGMEDPLNGHVVRDADGEPTGMLHEEAINWAMTFLPATDHATRLAGVRAGQAHANRHGITGVVDPHIEDSLERAYAELDQAGDLTLRVSGAAIVRANDTAAGARARLEAIRTRNRGPRFRVNAAKFFMDGGLENRTAAMIEPYADASGGNAALMFTPDQTRDFFVALDAARFQIHVHCIGDLATRVTLDGIEAARAANGFWPAQHQIAHVQITHPDDRRRFGELGVMANMQPLWAAWDPIIPDVSMDLVGQARHDWVYAFRSLIDAGAPYCINSDWPVSTLNPLEIIETAVTRQSSAGKGRREPFIPSECLTVQEAVAGYTTHAARAAWNEDLAGSLARGKSADFIVLDRDIFACGPHDIGGTKVLLTALEGQEVWRDPGFDG